MRARSFSLLVHLCPPVGHDHAGVSPLIAENRSVQVIVSGGPDAVDRVVARHNGADIAGTDTELKWLQVDLTQRTLGDNAVCRVAAHFLIVAAEML